MNNTGNQTRTPFGSHTRTPFGNQTRTPFSTMTKTPFVETKEKETSFGHFSKVENEKTNQEAKHNTLPPFEVGEKKSKLEERSVNTEKKGFVEVEFQGNKIGFDSDSLKTIKDSANSINIDSKKIDVRLQNTATLIEEVGKMLGEEDVDFDFEGKKIQLMQTILQVQTLESVTQESDVVEGFKTKLMNTLQLLNTLESIANGSEDLSEEGVAYGLMHATLFLEAIGISTMNSIDAESFKQQIIDDVFSLESLANQEEPRNDDVDDLGDALNNLFGVEESIVEETETVSNEVVEEESTGYIGGFFNGLYNGVAYVGDKAYNGVAYVGDKVANAIGEVVLPTDVFVDNINQQRKEEAEADGWEMIDDHEPKQEKQGWMSWAGSSVCSGVSSAWNWARGNKTETKISNRDVVDQTKYKYSAFTRYAVGALGGIAGYFLGKKLLGEFDQWWSLGLAGYIGGATGAVGGYKAAIWMLENGSLNDAIAFGKGALGGLLVGMISIVVLGAFGLAPVLVGSMGAIVCFLILSMLVGGLAMYTISQYTNPKAVQSQEAELVPSQV